MNRAASVICAIALAVPLGAQVAEPRPQPPPRQPVRDATGPPVAATGTGRIRGRIVQAGTTTPIRRAQVTLSGDQNVRRMVTTDADGRYEFSDLPAGRFTVAAAKGGYLTLQYGQRRAFEPGRAVTLAAAQVLGQVDLALPRGGAINGQVIDRFGEPAVGADILVERYQYGSNGQRRLVRAPGSAVTTNDLGQFRAFGLMPGEYIVSANIRQRPQLPVSGGPATPAVGYLQTYNPGTPNVGEAQAIRLNTGEEATVQFHLVLGQLARISGTIVDSAGRPAARAEMMLTSVSANGAASGRGSASTSADGAFSISNVPPGDHFIQVRLPPRPDGATGPEMANSPISTSGLDLERVLITTGTPATVSGVVEWEGTAPKGGGPAETPLRITAAAADGRPAMLGVIGVADPDASGAVSAANNTFRIGGLLGRMRFNATGVPPQWMVKAITAANVDLITTGIDTANIGSDTRVRVVLTDKVTELTGSVKNSRGEPAAEYVVVVLPEDAVDAAIAPSYTHALRPDQSGAFRLRALPPGRYVVAAVEALEQGSEWDPVFQATVRNGARRFTLAEGQTLTLNIDLMP